MTFITDNSTSQPGNNNGFLIDLIIYIIVMFLIREVYIPKVGFLANGLFWSITTFIVASWRMKVRGLTWKDLGLTKPKNLWRTSGISAIIVVFVIISIIIFEVMKDQLPVSLSSGSFSKSSVSKFGDLIGNWTRFFLVIPLVWMESMLEELLDRGFLMNWIEKLSSTGFATAIAVILQTCIFGFKFLTVTFERKSCLYKKLYR